MRAEVILLVPSCSLCSSGLHQGVGGVRQRNATNSQSQGQSASSQLPWVRLVFPAFPGSRSGCRQLYHQRGSPDKKRRGASSSQQRSQSRLLEYFLSRVRWHSLEDLCTL